MNSYKPLVINDIKYEVGDILCAISTFPLDNELQHTYYYGIGDEFVIIEIQRHKKYVNFRLFTPENKQFFQWIIDYDEFSDFQELLVHKKEFKKIERKLKLGKIGL